ncbi:MAG: hypothetical protein WAK42_08350 [Mycobacterium sp.]
MRRALFLQILQVVVTLMVSPLSAGIPTRFEAITPVITNELLSLAFLADLVGGGLLLIVASVLISSSVLDTAGPLGGLRASRVGRIDRPRRPVVKKESCRRGSKERL